MSSAAYSVVQTDAKTGNVIATLPVTDIQYTDTLNDSGSAVVGIPMFAPEADPSTLVPGASGLVVLRDDVPVWGGILWGVAADLDAGTLSLNASGFHSYYARRYLDGKNGYAKKSVDQSVLVKDWFAYCNANGGIGTSTSTVAVTGHVRTREWTFYEFKNVGEALDELADDLNGFNFRYVPYWITPGVRIGHRFVLSKRGTATFPQLEHAISCNVTSVNYDGTQLATQAYAFGADSGTGAKPYASSTNGALVMARSVSVATYSDIKSSGNLLPKAAAIANVGAQPIAVPTLTLYPNQFSPLEFVPGSFGTVIVDSGYVALFEEFALTERRVDIDANGTESVSLSLASKDVFNVDPS